MKPYHTNLYAIDCPKRIFIIDTFLGPEPMEEVKSQLNKEGITEKPYIVFNTHADYDHFWGNQSFEGSIIIAHEQAFKRVRTQGKQGLHQYSAQAIGTVRLTPPNLVFRKRIAFIEEGVEFFYTPGHTGDSSSCYDSNDKVLLPGDNLEAPYPYINLLNLKEYTQSLEEYKRLETKAIIPGHDPPQYDGKLLNENLAYIHNITSGHIDIEAMDQRRLRAHYPNTVRLAELYLEKSDAKKARSYYEEALKVLKLLESSPENYERSNKINARLSELPT